MLPPGLEGGSTSVASDFGGICVMYPGTSPARDSARLATASATSGHALARTCAQNNIALGFWSRPAMARARRRTEVHRRLPGLPAVNGWAPIPGADRGRPGRELGERSFAGGYTAVKRAVQVSSGPIRCSPRGPLRDPARCWQAQGSISPASRSPSPDEPGTRRIVWLFSLVARIPRRLVWARFVVHQDLGSVLCCHVAAFEALGGAPREILYDRLKNRRARRGCRRPRRL